MKGITAIELTGETPVEIAAGKDRRRFQFFFSVEESGTGTIQAAFGDYTPQTIEEVDLSDSTRLPYVVECQVNSFIVSASVDCTLYYTDDVVE